MSISETGIGDNLYANYDGRRFWLRTPLGMVAMSMPTVVVLHELTGQIVPGRWPTAETSVWHEESKKHYRAVLIRELTLDEVYSGLK